MQSSVRKALLSIFSEHEGQYLSGQSISTMLGCSRTAVWKQIEELRKEGYIVEAIPRKGYRIAAFPNEVCASSIQYRLQTKHIGQSIEVLDETSSTQKIAHARANDGVAHGYTVIADRQTDGRGRLQRSWSSIGEKGIWMSVVLRPDITPQQAPQLTLLVAVAIRRGIERYSGVACDIKWPNDLLYHQKKIVGVLTEMQADPDRVKAIIVGIGINVNHTIDDFPTELKDTASSLALATGTHFNRNEIVKAVLTELEQLYYLYLVEGFNPIKTLWEAYAITVGNRIVAHTVSGTFMGKALGITDAGVLLLQDDNDKIHHIYSADIELLPRQ